MKIFETKTNGKCWDVEARTINSAVHKLFGPRAFFHPNSGLNHPSHIRQFGQIFKQTKHGNTSITRPVAIDID